MIKTWLIVGTLGSGKTTLIRHLLNQRPSHERWGVLINDFGAIGIDEALTYREDVTLETIAGGCVCCVAAGALETALDRLAARQPDVLLVEPSGISEPEVLAERLRRHPAVILQGVVAVLDAAQYGPAQLDGWTSLQNMVTLADVVVLNKADLADDDRLDALRQWLAGRYPPKQQVHVVTHARLPWSALTRITPYDGLRLYAPRSQPSHPAMAATLPWSPRSLPHLAERRFQTGHADTAGWQWTADAIFDWRAIQRLFERLDTSPFSGTLRAKAVLRINDTSWMAFQWAGGRTERALSSWRRDSRLELIVRPDAGFDFAAFETALHAAQCNPSPVAAEG